MSTPDIANVPAALLVGGLATRLRPITETTPKALVDVHGMPFIVHQLLLLRRNGIRRTVLCTGYLGEKIEAHLGDGSRWGLEIRYSRDGQELLGTGGALRLAAPLLDEIFWVMVGDSYMDIDYREVFAAFLDAGVPGLMTVLHNDNRWGRSNALVRDGRLVRYDKLNPSPEMKHIDFGVALLRRAALDRLPATGPSDLATLYCQLVSEGQMVGFEVTNRFYDINTPESLEEARQYLAARDRFE